MQEQAGIESLSAFIKMQLFGKTFKVHVIDDNSREFIDKLSNLNNHYREIRVNYNLMVSTLRDNFTPKEAVSILKKVEASTVELIKLNNAIVALAKRFDEEWLQKYR